MNAPDPGAPPAEAAPIPRGSDGPVFPAPWAARVFALAVALNESGVFAWSEWADVLGPAAVREGDERAGDADAYWRAWLTALEAMLERKQVANAAELHVLQESWRQAAEATPHGQPVRLS